MTRQKTMDYILDNMTFDPVPFPILAQRINLAKSCLRLGLTNMAERGLVEKVALPKPTWRERKNLFYKSYSVGWRKVQ